MRFPFMLATLVPTLFATTSCGGASALERKGDQARAAGDRMAAAQAYDAAISEGRLMDYEYERLRDKRDHAKGAAWASRLDSLTGSRSEGGVAHAIDVVRLRREARDASADAVTTERLEAELTAATQPAALLEGAPELEDLIVLYDLVKEKRAPAALPGVLEAIIKSIDQGLPHLRARGGLAALTAFLATKSRVRDRMLPAAVDAAVDRQLASLGDVTVPAITAEIAVKTFDDAVELRARALAIGAPAAAVALAVRVRDAAAALLLPSVAPLVAKKQFVAAYDQLASRASHVEAGHPLLAGIASIRTQASAWHTEQAAKEIGATRMLHLGIASSFDPNGSAAQEYKIAAKELGTELKLAYTLAFDVTGEAACGDLRSALPKPEGGVTPVLPVKVEMNCKVSERSWSEQGSIRYDAEEEHSETKIVENETSVGGDDKCSLLSIQSGTCRVTHVITRTPVTTVTKRDVSGTQTYLIEHRDLDVSVAVFATVTAEDGTKHGTPVTYQRAAKGTAYSYTIPPRHIGEPTRGENVELPAGHTPEGFISGARSKVTGIPAELRSLLDTHRGSLARARGVAALRSGNAAAAGEEYLRSVLLQRGARDEAAAWLLETHGLSAAQASSVIWPNGSRASITPVVAAAGTPAPYTGSETGDLSDSYTSATATHETRGKDWLKKNVRPGSEPFAVRFGLLSYSMGGATERTPTAYSAGVEMWGAVIGSKLPPYGFVLHDELGWRAFIGGGDGLAWGAEGIARLFLGVRTHHVGVFAGASSGYLRASVGDTKAKGFHAEPAARVTVRFSKYRKLELEGTGFVRSFGDLSRSDRVAISLPSSPSYALRFSYERLELPTSTIVDDVRMDLGRTEVRVYGLEIGGSF
jgi:hypothetical protein